MTKIAGSGSESGSESGSGSISQRHGSADPDPPQSVMDPTTLVLQGDFSWIFFIFSTLLYPPPLTDTTVSEDAGFEPRSVATGIGFQML
jgi:hypothetical protein